MKIAILQNNSLTGACKNNTLSLLKQSYEAASKGATICIAPELCISGPNAGDLFLRSSFAKACFQELESLALKLHSENLPPLLVGTPYINNPSQKNLLQNCGVFLNEGKVNVITSKKLLPNSNQQNDLLYFKEGTGCGLLEYKDLRIAVVIGEDIYDDVLHLLDNKQDATNSLSQIMESCEVNCIVNLTATPFRSDLPILHEQKLSKVAKEYKVPVISANLVGGNDSQIYYGGSSLFAQDGSLTSRSPFFEEYVNVITLAEEPKNTITNIPEKEQLLWQAMVTGTRDFAKKCNIFKAVIGLSGGIDSALVAAIAVEALGKENVTGILMPSPYSSEGSVNDASNLARNLGITTYKTPISDVLESYRSTFFPVFENGLKGVTEENIQARIRGAIVMAYANEYGALVLNTGNKSEAAVGYCTLYGDQVGALCVIGDLYKHQVYTMSHWINKQRGKIIPKEILTKMPSAELRPGQKDSDSLPPYDILDGILEQILDKGKSSEEIVQNGYDPEVVEMVLSMLQRAEFKRNQAPTVLQLTKSFFGAIWHMPIAASFIKSL